jgi:hypothetical protein
MRGIVLLLSSGMGILMPVLNASAQDTPYIDDRSSASTLIQSFYNAVNRKEFARAWAYFGETKPAADLDAFAEGFKDTAQVRVITGNVASEGAAGSTIYHLPVAIAAFDANGGEKVFGGCYTLRLANPSIQASSFEPLHIEKGELKPSNVGLDEALPASCPDAPPPDESDEILARAKALFQDANPECGRNAAGEDQTGGVEQYTVAFNYSSDAEDMPKRETRVFRFYCGTGAYNESHVYYQYDADEGLRQLAFATPDLDIRYENDDTDGPVESITTIGYIAAGKLANSFYDEASQAITSHAKWRGMGDASASGTWILRNGRFSLVRYDVDASYDGEINPQAVLDFNTAP